MAKILGIVGSHRYLGNCEVLVKAVAEAAGAEHELDLLRLTDFDLKPCNGCYRCSGGNKCVQDDDLDFIIDAMVKADAVIFSAPTYVRGPSGIIKILGDRVVAIDQHLDDLWQKPAVVISAYGPEGDAGYGLTSMLSLVKMLGFDVKDYDTFLGALPGEALFTPGAEERIANMGKAIFGDRREKKEGECPYCGCNLWKFEKPGEAVCPICLTPAKFSAGEDGKMKVTYGKAIKKVYEYEWLDGHFRSDLAKGRKSFEKTRETLREKRNLYKEGYHWLTKESENPL